MKIKVLNPGLWTSVQDMGRRGYAGFGVPKSGVMDPYPANLANMLVGNDAGSALLEVTLQGPKLHFEGDSLIAVGGIAAKIYLNEKEININRSAYVKKGDVVHLEKVTKGSRIYLAVAGGFQTQVVLGSRSMYEGITKAWKLKQADSLPIKAYTGFQKETFSSVRFEQKLYTSNLIKVLPGPEFHLLSPEAKETIFKKAFTLSKDCNRMAFPLNEIVENDLESMLTSPVLPGTVQLTPSGQLIVLMCDAQITGGYPRILQLTEKSLNGLAQKRAGDTIGFEWLEDD